MRPSTLRLPPRCRALAYAALTAAMLAVPAGPAAAQNVDTQALLDRIERLERDIRTLNIQIARGVSPEAAAEAAGSSPGGGAAGGPALARLGSRVSRMEGDMRDLTGRIERMNHQLGQIEQRLDKLASDLEFRLSRLEGGSGGSMSGMASGNGGGMSGPGAGGEQAMAPAQGGASSSGREAPGPGTLGTIDPSAVEAVREAAAERDRQAAAGGAAQNGGGDMTSELPPLPGEESPAGGNAASSDGEPQQQAAVPGTADSATLPEGTPSEQYKHAFGLLRQGRYEDAAETFQQFLERHPDDDLAPNARYWLGETYYVRADYVSAAETFLEAYSQGADAPKAPDSLLKLGMSLAQLDKIAEACAAFEKVKRDYPDAPAGLRGTLDREMTKHECSS